MHLAQRIRDHFRARDQASGDGPIGKRTAVGYFYPAGVGHIEQAISLALHEGLMSPEGWYIDLGSGDGRGVFIPAGIFGIPSLGIEYDPEVSQGAVRDLTLFERQMPAPARLVTGDFTDPQSYDRLGVGFGEISTVFNYFNSHDDAVSMIDMFSPPGTTFLLLSITPRLERFDGLVHRGSFSVLDESRSELRLSKGPDGEVYFEDWYERAFLHVYEKT